MHHRIGCLLWVGVLIAAALFGWALAALIAVVFAEAVT